MVEMLQILLLLPVVVCFSLVSGQTEQFEYECDILQRMATFENRLEASDQLITELQDKSKESEETIGAQQETMSAQQETMSAQQETIDALQSKARVSDEMIKALTQKLQVQINAGSTYVRWGRTSCPGNGSELVYQGVAGGSWYDDAGGAAQHLCLPLEPDYRDYTEDSPQLMSGVVYGAEYKLFSRTNRMKFFPDIDATPDLLHQNVPCAVCRVSRNTMIMIPAKRTCMDGWTREFEGLLVSGYRGHNSATEYICLDDQPEVITGGESEENGKQLYFVESRCGSLPCPHYVNGRELSCVVCTK